MSKSQSSVATVFELHRSAIEQTQEAFRRSLEFQQAFYAGPTLDERDESNPASETLQSMIDAYLGAVGSLGSTDHSETAVESRPNKSFPAQEIVDAVEAGEMTDPGGMTTTQDVADVLPDNFETVEAKLRQLERSGAIEKTTFGGERVWTVPDEVREMPSPEEELFTATRVPQ